MQIVQMAKKLANLSRLELGDVWEGSKLFLCTSGCTRNGCFLNDERLLTSSTNSFAYAEMSLLLAKLHFKYSLELVNQDLDWEKQSHLHVMWWKPDMFVRVLPRDVKI